MRRLAVDQQNMLYQVSSSHKTVTSLMLYLKPRILNYFKIHIDHIDPELQNQKLQLDPPLLKLFDRLYCFFR